MVFLALVTTSSRQNQQAHHFDLSQAPSSHIDAVAWLDAPMWQSVMGREKNSLEEMGAFEESDLPAGEHTIGFKWVFVHKSDSEGANIQGKEKAWLVAQGFNQHPGQYDETYVPVAKMTSIWILLTWVAVCDLEIFQFDCKTAFLHTKLQHPIYTCQIPGYPLPDPKKVLCILVALYGLHQSAFEFHTLFSSLLFSLGMTRCEVDQVVFIGEWASAPDPSVSLPINGHSLVLYVPLHVDNGLVITNSPSLYAWFLRTLAKHLLIVDLGHCSGFLVVVIVETMLIASFGCRL